MKKILPLKRAVFLDRDGTINVEKEYLHRIEDFEFLPGAPQAIRRLNEAGLLVLVVTNQSGIGRGYYSAEEVETLHGHLQSQLNALGARIDGFYLCPHHPTEGVGDYRVACDCRKGEPGLLLRAAEDFGIDLASSWMVGDKAADIEAGVRAGCRPILVLTGYGRRERPVLAGGGVAVCEDLMAATDLILADKCGMMSTP
jgi:D-glycero-D-manno-heptose 1,7-bisphosphate phosphatase